jgi:hypothetical protein
MSFSLVISYYNSTEFLNFIEFVPNNWIIYIYNKSKNKLTDIKHPNTTIIDLPNVGRESDTYLQHIINFYDYLTDYTAFIQDDTHNHIQKEDYGSFISFVNSCYIEKTGFNGYPAKYRKCSRGAQKRTFNNGWNGASIDIPKDAIKICSQKLNIFLPKIYITYVCAHFVCSKQAIRAKNIEYYKNLLQYLHSSEDYSSNTKGYIFEHMWAIVFI